MHIIKDGIKFDDPEQFIIALRHDIETHVFDYNTQSLEATRYALDHEHKLYFIFIGRCGEILRYPTEVRRGKYWIGWARNVSGETPIMHEIDNMDLREIIEDIPIGVDEVYIHRSENR